MGATSSAKEGRGFNHLAHQAIDDHRGITLVAGNHRGEHTQLLGPAGGDLGTRHRLLNGFAERTVLVVVAGIFLCEDGNIQYKAPAEGAMYTKPCVAASARSPKP